MKAFWIAFRQEVLIVRLYVQQQFSVVWQYTALGHVSMAFSLCCYASPLPCGDDPVRGNECGAFDDDGDM